MLLIALLMYGSYSTQSSDTNINRLVEVLLNGPKPQRSILKSGLSISHVTWLYIGSIHCVGILIYNEGENNKGQKQGLGPSYIVLRIDSSDCRLIWLIFTFSLISP